MRRFHRLLGDLAGLADDEALGVGDLRARLRSLITPFKPERHATQVAAIRQELGRKSQDLARLLTLVRAADLAVPAGHAVATVRPFWQSLIDPAGSRRGARLLSRRDRDGAQRFIRGLNLPVTAEKYLGRLEAGLTAGLAALAEAVKAGAVAVEDGELRLPRRKPAARDPRVDPARQAKAAFVVSRSVRGDD